VEEGAYIRLKGKGMNFLKLIKAFGNLDHIYEGIKNNVFRKEHIEAAADLRWQQCKICEHIDRSGKECAVPKTQPCCSLCGCNLGTKLRSLSAECPAKKWPALMDDDAEELLLEQIEKNGSKSGGN